MTKATHCKLQAIASPKPEIAYMFRALQAVQSLRSDSDISDSDSMTLLVALTAGVV